MPIFLGHRLVLVELMRSVQGSQPIGAGSGGGEPNAAGFVFYVAHARDRAEGLAAKVQGSSLRLLRIYLMFDLSLSGGYALQLLQDSPELTRHARYRIRGYRSYLELGGSGCDSGR